MNITDKKLYYRDSHLAGFSARVIACEKQKQGWRVALEHTAFFPEGGGQLADTGYIGDAYVSDVQEADNEIWHYTDRELEVGQEYTCRIDFEKRFRRMQSHTGEHIVSGLAHRHYECENVGFHMGEECMTIDLTKELSWDELMDIEHRANEAVHRNLPVKAWMPEQSELAELDYRSKLELTENVRIVEIEGVDRCACCAPHVAYTGEVGVIKILDSQRHKGGVRVSLICGMDAVEDYRLRQQSVTQVSRLLSAKRHEIAPAVERILHEVESLKYKSDRLSMALVCIIAAGVEKAEGNICLFDDILDDVAQRELVNLLMEKCSGLAAVFCGSEKEGWRYIIGSKNIDLRKNTRAINSAINGKGGGSAQMIQGRAQGSMAEIEKNIKEMESSLA